MSLVPMYPGQEFTPVTTLLQGINATETRIYLADTSDENGREVFPAAPNFASIFQPGQNNGEVVRYIAQGSDTTGAFIDVIRGVSGAPQEWIAGTRIGRYFTALDLEALQKRLAALDANDDGAADKAEKLKTARKITINANSATPGTFDGSADATTGLAVTTAAGTASNALPPTAETPLNPWLTVARNGLAWLTGRFSAAGVLPIGNGGTGGTTAAAAKTNLGFLNADDLATLSAIHNRVYVGIDLTVKFASEIAAAPYNGDPWAWIQARARAANFTGLLVGDYIPFTANGYAVKAEIAGMDTYYQYGDTAVGHHIDFISRDCWPDTHVWNKVNYNNGTVDSPHPWLVSDIKRWLNSEAGNVVSVAAAMPTLEAVDYSTSGVFDKLPSTVKAVIIEKRLLLPSRYTAGVLLTDDNSWAWANAGKLWLPSEVEVYGTPMWGTKGNGNGIGGYVQYPIFGQSMKRIKKHQDNGSRSNWWLSTADGGNSTNCASVNIYGAAYNHTASYTSIRAPLCFRVA